MRLLEIELPTRLLYENSLLSGNRYLKGSKQPVVADQFEIKSDPDNGQPL